MSAIDQYDHAALGLVICPSSYEIVPGRAEFRVPIYRLDQDIPPDEHNFRGKRGDILLGGGSGEAPALHIRMLETLAFFTHLDLDAVPLDERGRADLYKAFWTSTEAYKFGEGYGKLGWSPRDEIELWLAGHIFAYLIREYPNDYLQHVGPEPLKHDGSICFRLTEADDRILNWT